MLPRRPDPRARFEALIAPHVEGLLAYARRLGSRPDDAEDLVQEAVVRAWRHLEGLRDDGAARAWLFRVLHSVAADDARARARRRALVEVVALEERYEDLVEGADPGPLEALLASASAARVEAALELVPEDFARAVELHDLHGLKYREIADVLGVPVGTVTSRINRGRRLLAAALSRDRAPGEDRAREEGHDP